MTFLFKDLMQNDALNQCFAEKQKCISEDTVWKHGIESSKFLLSCLDFNISKTRK